MEAVRLLVGPGGRIACRNAYDLKECDFKERHLKEKQVTIAGGGCVAAELGPRPPGRWAEVVRFSRNEVVRTGRAEAGCAALSWDGPGVNGASGNWLGQGI
ncbi:hypothetical protein [Streptomyces celluloflavus]|uniref:hypothetical protein n=1 Tax=Streptomyces celluloflavus TaxID=58344 RepID=UPI0036CB00F0